MVDLALRRQSANRLVFVGGFRPIGAGKALPIEPEAGHFLAQRPSRNVELFHHGVDLAAALRERAFDHRPLELLDLSGERLLRVAGRRAAPMPPRPSA